MQRNDDRDDDDEPYVPLSSFPKTQICVKIKCLTKCSRQLSLQKLVESKKLKLNTSHFVRLATSFVRWSYFHVASTI